MNYRLFFVLLVVTVATVKGVHGKSEGIWTKYAAKTLLTTPVETPFQQPKVVEPVQPKRVVPPKSARSEPVEAESEPVPEKAKPAKTKPVEDVRPRKLESLPMKQEIPLFAKMVLGDMKHPKLAKVEDLRKIDLRSGTYGLEVPTEQTVPLAEQLVAGTTELLNLFHEIQQESNGFVDDITRHNENEDTDYIGYFN